MDRTRLLIIDDNRSLVDMIKEYLISFGYSCHTTTFIPNKNFNNTRVKLYISWE